MHEVLHGHPTRSARLNEAFVFLPIGLVWPYRRFKTIHLQHHADERLTDPLDDPESYYRALWQHEELPAAMRWLLGVNNTMVGRFFLGPWLSVTGFVIDDFRQIAKGDRAIRNAWLRARRRPRRRPAPRRLRFRDPAVALHSRCRSGSASRSSPSAPSPSINGRSTPRAAPSSSSARRFAWFFLNNNLHFVHHKNPTVAWYRLPTLFRDRRDEWVAMNNGYVFPNYLALFSRFAFRAKEPVVHPALRRAPEPGRAFRPRMRGHASTYGAGSMPIPAEPPKE